MSTVKSIFYGQLPPSVSLMTPKGEPVYFYQGYHVTDNPDIIEFLKGEKNITNVTGKVKLDDVPVPPVRVQGNSWHSNAAQQSPTTITPAELLQRAAIKSSATVAPVSAPSNS